MAGTSAVNYEDPRLGKVESDKKQALTELEQTYAGMIGEADKQYQQQIDATKEWSDKQQEIQQAQTDFTIQQVEQQKEQAHKDYVKEQSGAYVDWQKQSNQYGVNAEQQASAGLRNTGYSESSQVGMYNTYQNRVAVARESYNNAVLNYNNAIKEAQLQNNSALAEIAYKALQTQLELSLEGFQYKNNLILEQTNQKLQVDQMYHDRYLSVLDQINTENAMAEEVRQFNLQYQQQIKAFNEEVRQYNQTYNEQVRQFNEEIARLKAQDAYDNAMKIRQLELQKQEMEEQKRQFAVEVALQQRQLEEEKRQFNAKLAAGSFSGSGSSGYSGSGMITNDNASPTGWGGPTGNTPTVQPSTAKQTVVTNAPKSGSVNGNSGQKASSNYTLAYTYVSRLASTGADRYQLLREIEDLYRHGDITDKEAESLKSKFVKKGS